jgi:tetratricopeptide (TPR) repeat protein
MRNRSLIVALIATLLTLAGNAQSIPDAPQPQKKPAPKAQTEPTPPPPAADDAPPADTKPAAKDDNAFPEAVSQAAAKQAAQQTPAPDAKPHSTGDDNPFPEAESKAAAKAAGNDPSSKTDLPPGVSSSQSSSADVEPGKPPVVVNDPARSRKDTEVGTFYLKDGNVKGALLRYQDASAADPTNVNAIFGMAEAQRLLGKKDEAARDYQMYLDIVPNGPRAKEAMKALKVLQASK